MTTDETKPASAAAEPPAQPVAGSRVTRWVRRVGVLGLVFFTVKGLLWIAIPALIARGLL